MSERFTTGGTLRRLAAALMTLAVCSTATLAATAQSDAQDRAEIKRRFEEAIKAAVLQQSTAASEVEQEQSGEAEAGGTGNGNGRDDDFDPAYEAEVQALTGKRLTITYTNAPPEIDGVMNDPEWNFAERVTDWLQREPDNGQPGSERTEVRLLFDDDAIYVGFWLYDSNPEGIIATDLRRDSRLDTDDTIAVVFDTYHDRRNGYVFRVNALGTKYDAEVRNERDINADWDERWDAATQITAEGWFVEMRIPFGSLRYNTGSHVWGIDFKREISRKNEEINWSNYRRGFQMNSISQFGAMVGLRNLGLTQRFRFQPYLAGSGSQFNVTDDPRKEADGDLGIEDFKVQLTPNLTADLTVNTDFAQVEDDNERVNLTRFPLFFPEKREFFLESASNFAFGSSGGRRGGFGMGPDVTLYHSRNIGLVDGEPVPIRYGAKLTGKIGSTNIGFVNAMTGDSEVDIVDGVEEFNPGKNFTVLRLKQDVLRRSSVGMIFTNAQGAGEYNRIAGVDANFRFYEHLSISGEVASVVADNQLEADPEADDRPVTGRFGAGWNSDEFSLSTSYQRVDDDFRTDLGFLRRRDIVKRTYRAGWNPRPSWAPAIRQFRISSNFDYLTDVSGEFLEQSANINLNTSFQSGDRITFNVSRDRERLDRVFFVSRKDEVFVLPGDYETQRYWVNFDSYNARPISGRMSVNWGDFWDGSSYGMRPGATFRFSEKLTLSPSYNYNHVELPTGVFDTHTISTRVNYNFNERWLTNSLVQYNSVSGRMSLFTRLRYVINEIDSFYVVYKSSRTWDEVWDGVADHQLIAKMTYSLDF